MVRGRAAGHVLELKLTCLDSWTRLSNEFKTDGKVALASLLPTNSFRAFSLRERK
jgi:hypothetical protein